MSNPYMHLRTKFLRFTRRLKFLGPSPAFLGKNAPMIIARGSCYGKNFLSQMDSNTLRSVREYDLSELDETIIESLRKVLEVNERIWRNLADKLGLGVNDKKLIVIDSNKPGQSVTRILLEKMNDAEWTVGHLYDHLIMLNKEKEANVLIVSVANLMNDKGFANVIQS